MSPTISVAASTRTPSLTPVAPSEAAAPSTGPAMPSAPNTLPLHARTPAAPIARTTALPGGSLDHFTALALAAHRILAPVVPALGETMTLVAKVRTVAAAYGYGRRGFGLSAAADAAAAHADLDAALAAIADIERALRDARAALSAPADVRADAAADPAHLRHSDPWGQGRALILSGVADALGIRRPSPARFNELAAAPAEEVRRG